MSPLLNYTTKINANKTVGEMQTMLAKAGASSVQAVYDEGRPSGLGFTIPTTHGIRSFLLPANVGAVFAVLQKDIKVPMGLKMPEHAERVAWRILKDWLEAQLAIIESQMVTLDQVMLPYMTDESGRTVYDLYASRQLALGAGT